MIRGLYKGDISDKQLLAGEGSLGENTWHKLRHFDLLRTTQYRIKPIKSSYLAKFLGLPLNLILLKFFMNFF